MKKFESLRNSEIHACQYSGVLILNIWRSKVPRIRGMHTVARAGRAPRAARAAAQTPFVRVRTNSDKGGLGRGRERGQVFYYLASRMQVFY
eukprot:COSAG02_NODE_11944_length_1626_cov_186.479371_3_plen_91_part_00